MYPSVGIAKPCLQWGRRAGHVGLKRVLFGSALPGLGRQQAGGPSAAAASVGRPRSRGGAHRNSKWTGNRQEGVRPPSASSRLAASVSRRAEPNREQLTKQKCVLQGTTSQSKV